MSSENEEAASSANSISPVSNASKRLGEAERPLDGLVSWLLNNGAVINNLTEKKIQSQLFSSSSDKIGAGRGLFATRHVEEGETLVRIPSNCLVNLTTLGNLHLKYPESFFTPTRADNSVKELSAHQQLTIFLLLESWNRKTSWWKEYIASLPPLSEFKGMPLLWTRTWQNQLPPAAKGTPHLIF